MARAKSVTEMINMDVDVLPFKGAWYNAFGCPDRTGVWLIWGNSGSGKTTFVMQLCKELCKYGHVAYNSLEEGASLTMRNTLIRCGMAEVNQRFSLLDKEPIIELSNRLKKQRSPDFIVIDSFQYTQLSYRDYLKFKEKHKRKLIILISHADGKQPAGRAAKSVMFDATEKVYVEGFRAFSRGRFLGPLKYIDIWPEEAAKFYPEQQEYEENK